MMAWPTIICGALCAVIGIVAYTTGTVDPEKGRVSPTALIPAWFGCALLLCGLLAFSDKLRKHAMHLAAMVGLFGVVGGLVPLIRQQAKGNPLDLTTKPVVSGLLMSAVCAVFVGLCVKSFRDARRARQAASATLPV